MLTYAGRSTNVVAVSFTVRIWRTMTLTVSTRVIRSTPNIKWWLYIDNLQIRKLKWEVSYRKPSFTAVVISVPHSPNCSPLCATRMPSVCYDRHISLSFIHSLFFFDTKRLSHLFGEHIKPSLHSSSRLQSPPPCGVELPTMHNTGQCEVVQQQICLLLEPPSPFSTEE